MRFDIKRMNQKPIKIKKGCNILLVLMTTIFVILLVTVATSKYWMPDDREIVALNNENTLNFNNKTLKLMDFYADYEKGMGEISFVVNQNTKSKDDLSFSLDFDGKVEYQEDMYRIIKGGMLPTQDENIFQQEYLIQFSLPEDFYYISLNITQDTIKTLSIQMDYRNFIDTILTVKSDNYLSALDDINVEIIKQTNIVNQLEEEVEGYEDTIQTLETQINELEVKIKVVTDENALKEKQAIINNEKKSLEDAKKVCEERKSALDVEQSTLENLLSEKGKQR